MPSKVNSPKLPSVDQHIPHFWKSEHDYKSGNAHFSCCRQAVFKRSSRPVASLDVADGLARAGPRKKRKRYVTAKFGVFASRSKDK